VKFDPDSKELHLYLSFEPGSQFSCPACGAVCKAYDTSPRVWRHLNFFEHKSFLHADFPRTDCRPCGVKTPEAPWARPGSGFTLLFEALVLTLCRHMPVSAASRLTGEHDTRLWRILEAYVEGARERTDMSGVSRIGVDETSFKPGHQYVTLVSDLDSRRVLFVTEGKDAQTMADFKTDFQAHKGEPGRIETVCMDLSPAFAAGVSEQFPQAAKVFDRFHVVKLANAAVDSIRRAEAKTNALLKRSRYLWLANPGSLSPAKRERLAGMTDLNLHTR
jgi:transposase